MGGGGGGGDRPSDRVQTILGNYAEFPEVHITCMCLKQVCCAANYVIFLEYIWYRTLTGVLSLDLQQ